MRKISKIEPKLPVIQARKKVAAYARVSRDTERLMHSVSAQVSYYSALIQKNPEWEYAGVYADMGISGTDTSKRGEFLRMLADCEEGKIDIILTKSISRFARNTVDLLELIQQCVSENAHVALDQAEYQARYNGLAERFDRTKARLDEVGNAITEKQAKKEQIERFLAELERQDGMATEFDEEQWYSLVDFVTVFNKEDIRFTFKNGTEIKV